MSVVLGVGDFTYIGSFGVPQPASSVYCVDLGQSGTDVKGFPGGLGFNPPNAASGTLGTAGSLLLEGQLGAPNGQQYCKGNPVVAELQIPPDGQLNPNSGGDVTQLARASVIQFGFLLSAANGISFGSEFQSNGTAIGGMVVANGKIYWNIYDTYSSGVPNVNAFGYSSTTLSASPTGTAIGRTAPGTNVPNDAWGVATGEDAGGYIAEIPPSWRTAFNGRSHFCGLGGVSLVSRCSNGPAMHCFSVTDVGVGADPSPSDAFLSYPTGNALRFANGTKGWGVFYAPNGSVLGQDDTLGMMSGAFFMDDGSKMGVCFLTHIPAGTGWYGFGTFWAWQHDTSSGISDLIAPAKGTVWTMPSGRTFVVDNIPPLVAGRSQPAGFSAGTQILSNGPNQPSGVPNYDPTPYIEDWVCDQDGFDKGVHTQFGGHPALWIYDPNDIVNNWQAGGPSYAPVPKAEILFTDIAGGNPYISATGLSCAATGFAGMVFDPVLKRVYVAQRNVDGSPPYNQYDVGTLIHVYQVRSAIATAKGAFASKTFASKTFASKTFH